MLANFLSVLSLASLVASHGVVKDFIVDGKKYTGPDANGAASRTAAPIRQISTFNPNYGATTGAITCGPGARFASQIATVNPGSRLGFDWRAGPDPWPHNTGPMLTYLTKCTNGDCKTFNATNAQWFKIDAAGYQNGKWIQGQTIYSKAPGGPKPYYFNFPKNIAPGQYILRHEIIALHLASARKQAEFYPSCIQISVTGSGTGAPAPNELVKLPGAYSDDDPGIWCRKNEQFGNGNTYVMPGPKVSTLAVKAPAPSGGSPPTDDDDTPPPVNAGSGPKCKVNKKRSPSAKRLRRAKRNHAQRRMNAKRRFESATA